MKTIYVSNNGSDETGDGSKNKPFRTIPGPGVLQQDTYKVELKGTYVSERIGGSKCGKN